MKHSFAALLALVCIATPLSAFAEVSEVDLRVMHILGQIAAITAEKSGTPVACALISTKESVRVNEPFKLIWNSFGAVDPGESSMSQWERGGAFTIVVDTPGIKQYRFVFYAPSGEKAVCTVLVSIVLTFPV